MVVPPNLDQSELENPLLLVVRRQAPAVGRDELDRGQVADRGMRPGVVVMLPPRVELGLCILH